MLAYTEYQRSTKTLAKVCRAEAWTFVCRETSSSLTKWLIMRIQSSDHKVRLTEIGFVLIRTHQSATTEKLAVFNLQTAYHAFEFFVDFFGCG